ncbi:Uncharacterised protein [Vibrio cholerae]|nr:Uncharacterised protein [Vibrio cholerae]
MKRHRVATNPSFATNSYPSMPMNLNSNCINCQSRPFPILI